MADETTGGYPLSMRAIALLGLLALAGLAFILADVATGGRLTGGCADCREETAGA
jgi:hypothetical protein